MKRAEVLAAIGIFVALWGFLAVGSALFRKPSNPYTFDFFPRWYGAREVIFEGESNPYSREIEDAVQSYQQFDDPLANLPNFLYPAPVIYILLPFWILPWDISINLWTGLTLTLALVLPLVVYLILDWRIPPLLLALICFCSAFIFRHSMNTYLIGQFVMFILANLIFSWWATVHKKPALSAFALICTTIRPEGAIFAGAMLFDLLLARHFKTVAIWVGIMGGILMVSFLQLGWWVDDMLDVVQVYRDCCTYTNPASEVPGGRAGEIVMILIVIGWAAWMLIRMRHLPDLTRIPWSLSTVIVATLLISTQSKDYTLIYLLIPLWVSLWSTRGHWLSSLAVLAVLASSWVYWRMGLTVNDGDPKEQLLMPIFTGIVLTFHWLTWSRAQVVASSEFDSLPETLPAA